MDKKLANDTVYAKLRKILAAIYALAQVDTDAKTQISVILGVSLDLLTTPLKSLYANPSKQEQIVHSLKLAKTKFERLAQLLSQLAVSTQGTVKAANVIMNIWESVQSGLEALSSTTRTLNEKEAATVSTAWASASSTLAKIIDILTGAIQLSSSINLAKANTNDFGEDVIPIPQDKNTLTFLRALHNTEAQKSGPPPPVPLPPTFELPQHIMALDADTILVQDPHGPPQVHCCQETRDKSRLPKGGKQKSARNVDHKSWQ